MRNESQDRGDAGASDRGPKAGREHRGQNTDVPGYEWQDAGAAMTTGRDFDQQRWPEQTVRDAAGPGGAGGESNQTTEPGPTARSDAPQPPEETSGLDRPASYRQTDRADRPTTEPGTAEGRSPDHGIPPQPFGDHRYGQPDEWSSHQREWPNRPRRFEEVTSGFGTGMGAGMYWSGESAREDDEMQGRMPDGEQIPTRGSLAPRGPYAGRGPRGYRRSDERIAEDVSDRLTDDDYLDASDISVAVQDGVVVLEGTVESDAARRRAVDIADSCSGVADVKEQLEVRRRDAGVSDRISNPTG